MRAPLIQKIMTSFVVNGRDHSLRIIVLLAFLVNILGPLPLASAQEFRLPKPGVMVHLSPEFNPPILKGIKIHTDNPFKFDFILDTGDENTTDIKSESTKLIKYFLASLTIPEQDLWVNLSPYEKDRIIPNSFGLTEMGRDLLAEDYMLKQITASLIYPEDEVGKKFWKRIYEEAQAKYHTTNIPVNTFNKVWIVPEKAVVYESAKGGSASGGNVSVVAYVVESKLKVMLEGDYLSMSKHNVGADLRVRPKQGIDTQVDPYDEKQTNAIGSQIIREIVIPELTKEVNENQNFSQLRQVYNSLILATWYKKKIKDSILSQVYADKNKTKGIEYNVGATPRGRPDEGQAQGPAPTDVELIYQRYLSAFKKGVYNYIKEDLDPVSKETVPRKYFSGGVDFAMARTGAVGLGNLIETIEDRSKIPAGSLSENNAFRVEANTMPSNARPLKIDKAMTAPKQPAPESQPASQQLIDEITQILHSFPLSDEEIAKWSRIIRSNHQLYSESMKSMAKDADDPTFYEFSIRENKLLIEEFMLNFKEAIANPQNAGIPRENLLGTAYDNARKSIWDGFFPASQRNSIEVPADQETTNILKWILHRQKPTLLVRPLKGFDTLERGWEQIQKDNPNIIHHTLTGTPATDRRQLIGDKLPSEPTVDGKQALEFRPGMIIRMIEMAKMDPTKTYVLQIDNFEAIPEKVRSSMNELLNVGRMQIPEAPEGQQELIMPENLKIVATITEGAIIKDSSLYDRFVRKWLPEYTKEDLIKSIRERFDLKKQAALLRNLHPETMGSWSEEDLKKEVFESVMKHEIIQKALQEFLDRKLSLGEIYILFENIFGRLGDYYFSEDIVIREEWAILKGTHKSELGWNTKFQLEQPKTDLEIDGVPLPLSAQMKERWLEYWNKNQTKQEDLFVDFFKEQTGLTLTQEILKAFSASARALRYGNGIVRLEGLTGVGKTFFAQVLAKLMGVNFYGEPINGSSKESRWHGEWVVDGKGTYHLKTDTPFMNILRNGGVTALSELNTAVEKDYARLGWWLIPLAQGQRQIELNQYPQPEDSKDPFPVLNRHPKSLIIIDINPSESYEARGKLPVLLQANTMLVWMEGRLAKQELKKIATDYLSGMLDTQLREVYAEDLARVHHALQEELRQEDRTISKDQPHVVTLRELKRAAQIIMNAQSEIFSWDAFYLAADSAYTLSFTSIEDQEAARDLIDDILNPTPSTIDMPMMSKPTNVSDSAMVANPSPSWKGRPKGSSVKKHPIVADPVQAIRTSMVAANQPTMLIMPSTVDPKKELDASLADVPHEIVKIRCNNPDMNHLTLFGGYLIDTQVQEKGERKFKLADGIITQAILQAQKMADEDKNLPLEKRRKLVLWMEGFYYLRPQLAIALNALLQEGTLVTADGRTLQVPENMRFFASVSGETKPEISLAEQSRWVRLNMKLDQLSSQLTPAVKHYSLNDITEILEKKISAYPDSPYSEFESAQEIFKPWLEMMKNRIKKGMLVTTQQRKILIKLSSHPSFLIMNLLDSVIEFIQELSQHDQNLSDDLETVIKNNITTFNADNKNDLKNIYKIYQLRLKAGRNVWSYLDLIAKSAEDNIESINLVTDVARDYFDKNKDLPEPLMKYFYTILSSARGDFSSRVAIVQFLWSIAQQHPKGRMHIVSYHEGELITIGHHFMGVLKEKWNTDTSNEKLGTAQMILEMVDAIYLYRAENGMVRSWVNKALEGQAIPKDGIQMLRRTLRSMGASRFSLDAIAEQISSLGNPQKFNWSDDMQKFILIELAGFIIKDSFKNQTYDKKTAKNLINELRNIADLKDNVELNFAANQALMQVYTAQIESGNVLNIKEVDYLLEGLWLLPGLPFPSNGEARWKLVFNEFARLYAAVMKKPSLAPEVLSHLRAFLERLTSNDQIWVVDKVYLFEGSQFDKDEVQYHLNLLSDFLVEQLNKGGYSEADTVIFYKTTVQLFISTGLTWHNIDGFLNTPYMNSESAGIYEDPELIISLSDKLLSAGEYERHAQLRAKLLNVFSKLSELSDKQKESISKILDTVYEHYGMKGGKLDKSEYESLDPNSEKGYYRGLLRNGNRDLLKYFYDGLESSAVSVELLSELALMRIKLGDGSAHPMLHQLITGSLTKSISEIDEVIQIAQALVKIAKINKDLSEINYCIKYITTSLNTWKNNKVIRDALNSALAEIYLAQAQRDKLNFDQPWSELEADQDPLKTAQILAWMQTKAGSIVDSFSNFELIEDHKGLASLYPVFNSALQAPEDELLEPIAELVKTEKDIIKAWKEGRRVVVLEGDPGGGKTDIGIDVAKRWGLPFDVYSAHGFSSLFDLIGGYTQDEKGQFILTAQPDAQGNYRIPFLQLLTHGGVFVIDEGAVGAKARALIGWLTGLARGEKELVLNEHIGAKPQVFKVHPEFHLIITTNPPETTAGRMDLPPEILNNAVRLSVNNRFNDLSYQELLKRWHTQAQKKPIAEEELTKTMQEQIRRHKVVIEFVEKELQDNPERHLMSLRDLRNWTKAMHDLYAKGMTWQEALERGFELVYLKQFAPDVRQQLNQRLQPQSKGSGVTIEDMKRQNELIDKAKNLGAKKIGHMPVPSFNWTKPGVQLTGPTNPSVQQLKTAPQTIKTFLSGWEKANLLDLDSGHIKNIIMESELLTKYKEMNFEKTKESFKLFIEQKDIVIINFLEEIIKSDKLSEFKKKKLKIKVLWLKAKLWVKNKFKSKIEPEHIPSQEDLKKVVDAITEETPSELPPETPTESDQAMISETATKKDLQDTLDMGFHALLLLEPGTREEEIINDFVKENDYQLVNLEATPELMPLELLGGAFPVLPGEVQTGQDFRVKPGFLTRHLIREGQKASDEKKLLVIHNIDALPERVRVVLNNFLLKGYVDVRDDSGGTVRMKLPDNVKLAVTMSSTSQKEFSSAFFNRFIKIHTQAPKADIHGFSESLNWIMSKEGLDERSARKIQMLFDMIRNLQSGNYVWPSGKTFLFTVKDMFLHARFVNMAIEEAKQSGSWDGNIDPLIAQEALRLYGGRLQEDPRDIQAFVTAILKSIVPNAQEMLSGVLTRSPSGGISHLAGVPLQMYGRTEAEIDPTVRLTLVPRMVNTLSTILRGWQAGKMVAAIGETAGAKTSMGRYLAQLMGFEYYVYSTHGQSKSRDLTASLELTDQWEYRLAWREFLKRLAKGNQVIILDEVNLRPEMVWVLNGLARGQKTFTVEMPGEKPLEIKVGENVHFLLTMNPDAYAGRGLLPEVFEENILRTWVPTQYPDGELELILSDFLRNKQKAIISWAQAQRQLQSTGYQRTKEELLGAIQKEGRDKVFKSLSPQEKAQLMEAILADPKVRQKMDAIRVKIGSQMKDVQVVFSWHWWAMQIEGKVRHVFVPLDELAREDRSPEAVVGLIIHELRHRRFTPSTDEIKDVINPQLPEDLQVPVIPEEIKSLMTSPTPLTVDQLKKIQEMKSSPLWRLIQAWRELSNIIEDVTIDHIVDPNLPGEQPYLEAMIQEFFHRPASEEQSPEEVAKIAAQNPVGAFLTKVLLAGYPPQKDLRMGNYPSFVQEAVHAVIDGGTQSILHQATLSKEAVPDLSGRLNRQEQHQENLRAAAHRVFVMQKAIWPMIQELIKKEKLESDQSSQEGQEEGQTEGGMGAGMGLPTFGDLTPEQVGQLLQALPKGAVLPAGDSSGGQSGGAMTNEDRGKEAQDYKDKLEEIKKQRAQEIALNEPLNERLMAVNAYAKMLAKKLIQIFRSPEEPSLEYAANGFFIDPVLFLLRDKEPFIEEVEREGKPNLAIGLTIDRSGSMGAYEQAVEQLMALFIETFQAIDKSKGQFSVNYFDTQYHPGKDFQEKFPSGDLNGYFSKMIAEFAEGGSTSTYAAVEGIVNKYRNITKKNKVEIILTDGDGGDMTWDAGENRYVPSARLKAKFEEAKKMGVQLIGVGFGTREVTVFDRYIQLDQSNALSLVEILLKIAQQSSVGQPLPLGDLSKGYASVMKRAIEAQRARPAINQRLSAVLSSLRPQQDTTKTKSSTSLEKPIQDPGGIDFNPDKLNLQIQNDNGQIKIKMDPVLLEQLKNTPGFVPVIINIQPLKDLPGFLGLNQDSKSKEMSLAKV